MAIAIGMMAHKHSSRTGADYPVGAIDLLSEQVGAGDPACTLLVNWLARCNALGADELQDADTVDVTDGGRSNA